VGAEIDKLAANAVKTNNSPEAISGVRVDADAAEITLGVIRLLLKASVPASVASVPDCGKTTLEPPPAEERVIGPTAVVKLLAVVMLPLISRVQLALLTSIVNVLANVNGILLVDLIVKS
jgi:hypothetical protein